MDTTNDTAAKPPIPLSSWPGAFGVYGPSRDAVRRNLSTVVLLWLLTLVISIAVGFVFGRVFWLNELVAGLVGAVLGGAQIYAYVGSVRGQRVELPDAIGQALPLFFKLFVLNLLVLLSIFGGLILLIVPGLIILPRLVLAPYFLIDQQMGVLESYQASWDATKGHAGKVWGLIGMVCLMVLPSITILLIPLTIYLVIMYSASTSLLYQYLLDHGRQPTAKPHNAPATE